MQNVSNYMCPFFLEDGLPDIAGRVHFVQPSCSAAPEEGTDPDYILIYDKDHTPLENPLPLNDEGVFEHQPFVEDGIDFRMIVEAPTGIDDAPWRTIAIIDSKAQVYSVTYSGLATCDSLSDLRQLDPAVGKCLVLGYSSAGDCCPTRVFKWETELLTENYGTHVRSTLAGKTNAGTWVCEPSGFVDARWFGLDEGGAADDLHDASTALGRCHASYPNMRTYVPKGWYGLDSSVAVNYLMLDRETYFVPSVNDDIIFAIDEIYGDGNHFCAIDANDASSKRVIPVLSYGTLKTSWIFGSLNEFLTAQALNGVNEIIFDEVYYQGTTAVTIENKMVRVCDGVTINNGITFSDCIEFREGLGYVYATEYHISKVNKSLVVDIDGMSVGNPSNTANYGAAGATITDGTFTTEFTFSHVSFTSTQGTSELTHSHVEFHASSYRNVSLSGNGLVVSKGASGSEEEVYVKHDTIESKAGPAPFQKGLQCKWALKSVLSTEISAGAVFDLDDSVFTALDDAERVAVIAKFYSAFHNGYVVDISATPTKGRVIKIVNRLDDINYYYSVVRVSSNNTTKCVLLGGASAILVADGTAWNMDYGRE